MTTTCTRRLEIDAGHRLMKHEGKCKHVHGHRYLFDITCLGERDEVGRVIDFSKVKELVGGWLDTHLDHGFIAQRGDSIIRYLDETGGKVYITEFSPTAENLAEHVMEKAGELLTPLGIAVVRVVCYETPNCWAIAGALA
jgi:6-pyruvoyltetrahydropterin/6-carboxytetrahydropterin synthase